LLVTAVGRTSVVCSTQEFLQFQPTNGQTCQASMESYIGAAGGYLLDPQATDSCNFCQIADTDVFLSSFNMSYGNRWRDLGLMVVYIAFNIAAAVGLYWLARVPKKSKADRKAKKDAAKDKAAASHERDEKAAAEKRV
jgi:ATP-binding cassette subfamily G (WHITE) protein 2 (PDR)